MFFFFFCVFFFFFFRIFVFFLSFCRFFGGDGGLWGGFLLDLVWFVLVSLFWCGFLVTFQRPKPLSFHGFF